ncbi:MAG: type II toxin-antitoxin system HicB family antitoxin [Candidatus Omnitrophica bacterium]|nr:type II toxin-antitoxin system HicB family antitoxin [Candidatus Omnitrophota bacterium]
MARSVGTLQIKIPIQIIKEDDVFVAYTPALDLCTQGDTYEEAAKMLDEIIRIFFEECIERGTLEQVLKDCGWRKVAHKKEWIPPRREVITEKNESFTVPCPA